MGQVRTKEPRYRTKLKYKGGQLGARKIAAIKRACLSADGDAIQTMTWHCQAQMYKTPNWILSANASRTALK